MLSHHLRREVFIKETRVEIVVDETESPYNVAVIVCGERN